MKKFFDCFSFVAIFAVLVASCSNSSDNGGTVATGTGETPSTTSEPQSEQPQTPTPVMYTITFNANNGCDNPPTATQVFSEGTSQPLKTISELGFSKDGFYFAGWGIKSDAVQSSFADGTDYIADADRTLYALWKAEPVYSVYILTSEHGRVIASPATAVSGTEICLSNVPDEGYVFSSYSVTDEDSNIITVTNGKFIMPASNVTISSSFEQSFVFIGTSYTKTGKKTIKNKEYDIVAFGDWPQTLKSENVSVNENEFKIVGAYTYNRGSDGAWYYKKNSKFYKVEPIYWRVLTENYNETGKKLLLAEKVLIGKSYDKNSNVYKNSEIRTWLNGDFYNTAFTLSLHSKIVQISLDNSERSTLPNNYDSISEKKLAWNDGVNQYASENTYDYVFLLSEKEATTTDYGFSSYNGGIGAANTKLRLKTNFVNNVYYAVNYGCRWWLRSPIFSSPSKTRIVDEFGGTSEYRSVDSVEAGVVPALCVDIE